MGQPKHKWIQAEEDALRRGVERYGAGKWKSIHQDPEFAPILSSRSTVDLKDKWRNLSGSNGQIPRDKSKTKPKTKNVGTSIKTAAIAPVVPAPRTCVSPVQNQMKYESLLAHEQPNNIDCGELEEIENIYMIEIDEQPAETNDSPPTVVERESEQMHDRETGYFTHTMEQASLWAASMIAEAENRSFVAVESMREAERISAMAEETEAMVQFARECLDTSHHFGLPPK